LAAAVGAVHIGKYLSYVYPIQNGVAGGDGFQIWRVDANVLNKQSQTADKGWSSSLRVGRGANTSLRKLVTKYYRKSREHDGGACSTHGRDEKSKQNLSRKT